MALIRDALLSLREMPAFSLETMQEVVDPEFRPWELGDSVRSDGAWSVGELAAAMEKL
jgi:hypothetical protein